MRQGHHGEQLLEAKGKLFFSLFFLPGPACPLAPGGCAGQLGAARPRFPARPGARRSCCQQRGTERASCPSPSSPPAPDVLLCRWLLCPSFRPLVPKQPLAGAGSSSAPGSACSSSRPGHPLARRGRAVTTFRSGNRTGHPALALGALRSQDAANFLPKSRVQRPSTRISLGNLGEDGVGVAARQDWTRTGTITGTRTGPCSAGRSRGSGALGCAGSRSGGAFAAMGDPRERPGEDRRLPRTPGMVGRVTGKGPRFAPLNLAAGRRFTM